MKKKLLSLLLVSSMVLSLGACGGLGFTGGSPWINSDIESNVKKEYDTDLKDDFALAINKDWSLANSLEDGEIANIYAVSFSDELNSRLQGILTDTSYDENNHDAELVSTLNATFLDWDARDAAGVTPVMPYLEDIVNINSIEDFYAYSTDPKIKYVELFGWFFSCSLEDSTVQSICLYQPEYFLTDPSDYENIKRMNADIKYVKKKQKELVSAVLLKCGYTKKEINDIYNGSLELEQKICQYCYTNDELPLTSTIETMNEQVYSPDELSCFEGIEFYLDCIEKSGITDVPEIQLNGKIDYYEHLNEIYCEENLEIIKDYLIAHTAFNVITLLDKELYYKYLDVQNEFNGVTGYKSEEEYALKLVSNTLGWPLSKLYCDKYVTKEDKQLIYDIICDIIDEYEVMVSEEEFLSKETKANAIRKLNNMQINCMYPDEWKDYSELELSGTFFDMKTAILEFEFYKMVDKFHDPIDRAEWIMTPITANACYSPANNSINILPGLVGDVLYNDEMEIEEVYAMVGSVIGHEISHGFDPRGAMYDENGNYKDWWTEEDHEAFGELTQNLVDYYDGITVWNGLNCKGELVKGEACADMAGMACTLRLASKIDDFDYDLYFRSFSRMWATNASSSYEYNRTLYNEHPVSYLRINTVVAQFDEFYETYDIKEGDGMYIAPEDRVKIW